MNNEEQAIINRRHRNRRYWRRHKYTMPDRTEYWREYYRRNRERKLAAYREKRAAK